MNVFIVIMAGGIGTRLWPRSTPQKPKQFVDVLNTGKTLLQETYERHVPLGAEIYVLTSQEHLSLTQQQLPGVNVIAEPCRRNTAPAIALITLGILDSHPNAIIVFVPSDHLIGGSTYLSTLQAAIEKARYDMCCVTLGICPTEPNINYGYIEYGTENKILNFVEKPDAALAKVFCSKGYLWNSGIFVWNSVYLLKCFEQHCPTIIENIMTDRYDKCQNISIDYAIMEHVDNAYVIPSYFEWSDLGTWPNIYALKEKDAQGNVCIGNVEYYNCKNCFIYTDTKVVLKDLEGIFYIKEKNETLVFK